MSPYSPPFPHVYRDKDDRTLKVPYQYDGEHNDGRFFQKAREINEAAEAVCLAHDMLVRRARTRLALGNNGHDCSGSKSETRKMGNADGSLLKTGQHRSRERSYWRPAGVHSPVGSSTFEKCHTRLTRKP